jgi:hypothetical protein
MKKVLRLQISRWQIALVLFATVLGMVCLGLPMMLYGDASKLLQHEHRLFDEKFLVLNKRVSMMHTLGVKDVGFSKSEIDSLAHLKGVEGVGSFENNAFELWAEADFGGGQVVRTELFLEGVEDEFIDDPPPAWFWAEGQKEVPIMVPSDYLALYNFGFAPGQNLPGISKDLAKQSRFTLYLSGNGRNEQFEGRIAGFSDRIETILTPKSFLTWANQHFAPTRVDKPKRVIIKASESVALQHEMTERGYETNKEKLQTVRFQQLVKQVFGGAYLLGICMVLLAIGSFILFSNLVVTRSHHRLRTLFLLGFDHRQLQWQMARRLLIFPVVACAISWPVALYLRWVMIADLRVFIGESTFWPGWLPVGGVLLVLMVYLAVAWVDMGRQLKAIGRSI